MISEKSLAAAQRAILAFEHPDYYIGRIYYTSSGQNIINSTNVVAMSKVLKRLIPARITFLSPELRHLDFEVRKMRFLFSFDYSNAGTVDCTLMGMTKHYLYVCAKATCSVEQIPETLVQLFLSLQPLPVRLVLECVSDISTRVEDFFLDPDGHYRYGFIIGSITPELERAFALGSRTCFTWKSAVNVTVTENRVPLEVFGVYDDLNFMPFLKSNWLHRCYLFFCKR